MYKYKFTTTVDDLLTAENESRSAQFARTSFCWVTSSFGMILIVSGILSYIFYNQNLKPIIWICIGYFIIYYFFIKIYTYRNKVKRNNYQKQDISIEFYNNYINIHSDNNGNLIRRWENLIEFVELKKGIIFYFDDGVINWLPNRVFLDKQEQADFIAFLKKHQSQESSSL